MAKCFNKNLKKKIIVKEFENLMDEFGYAEAKDNWDAKGYQKFIDEFIEKNKKKHIIFIGNNNMAWWDKDLFYDLQSKHNFFLEPIISNLEKSDELIFDQKCRKYLKFAANAKILPNIEDIKTQCDREITKKVNNYWREAYKKQNYNFSPQIEIYRKCLNLLK